MKYKAPDIAAQFDELPSRNPMLYAILCVIDKLAMIWFDKQVTITSIHREEHDPYFLHRSWRAADLRLGHGPNELTKGEWEAIAELVHRAFAYGKTGTGNKTECLRIRTAAEGHHEFKSNDHVHCQVKRVGAWS